jgi:Ca2+-transporting ATPase
MLTRRIAAIETLGATSVLCGTKTGTAENRMTVAELYARIGLGCRGLVGGGHAAPPGCPSISHPGGIQLLASVADRLIRWKTFHRMGQHLI